MPRNLIRDQILISDWSILCNSHVRAFIEDVQDSELLARVETLITNLFKKKILIVTKNLNSEFFYKLFDLCLLN